MLPMIKASIDDKGIQVEEGTTILEAAHKEGIYIPTLCYHPDLKGPEEMRPEEFIYQGGRKIINSMPEGVNEGCGICLVALQGVGDLIRSCTTEITDGMVIITENERIRQERTRNFISIMKGHPHACLVCPQQEGCDLLQCSADIPVEERCCAIFGHCELQDVANYLGIDPTTPRWIPTDLPAIKDGPLFEWNYNLCIGCLRCLRACNDLRGVGALGFVFDKGGEIQVGSLSSTLGKSGCRFCTACVEVCPTGALIDKDIRAGHEEDLLPCNAACPADIDIPGYLRLIAEGKADEANALIREKVPFPGILGRVCSRPCEDVCRRGDVNEPVSICALKRFAGDNEGGLWKGSMDLKGDTGHRVAIIGSGPAGLTAAFYLKKKGHQVTVFESRPLPGGMMRYGIPEYRLPLSVVEKEIRDILDFGIVLNTGRTLGKDLTIDVLKEEGYEAVFLAVGAQLSRKIELEDSDLKDVLWGVDFLYQVKEGRGFKLKDKVIVLGGGNVAIDVALTALRCGATHVTMACLEKREEMPADDSEIHQAIEDGVEIMTAWGPNRILSGDGQVRGIELIGCSRVFDKEGDFSPTFDERRRVVEADQVILAIGQATDLSFIDPGSPIDIQRGMIVVDGETLETGIPGVFAGGDVTKAPGAIIHAIVAGRKAASSIDRFLGGDGDIEETLFQPGPLSPTVGRVEGFADLPRQGVPELPPAQRLRGFKEVALGFDRDTAGKEASRCLQCDLRLGIKKVISPPARLLQWTEANIHNVPQGEGVYQLLDASKKVLVIKGVMNMRESLLGVFEEDDRVAWFEYEEDPLYSKRESELIQQYLRHHGEMPGEDELNDLF
ncbi:MAG: FAD-dependent oxidoreductase [Deltaproteobacteria bacterium]|nr:MAG: FAD-dependent oxidoreductase [Deltaproteobacteria bacterium]